jgi:molybdopterin converting factor subunit 1
MIRVRVKYFAMCREITRRDEETVILSDTATVEEFWVKVISQHPALAPYRSQSRIAVNMEYVSTPADLSDNDEVCIIPPVSGG